LVKRPGDGSVDGSRESDADVLSGLRGRRSVWQAVVAVLWAALAVMHLVVEQRWLAIAWGLAALLFGWTWWAGPQPQLRSVTDDALHVRQGLRTRTVQRADVLDVQPTYLGGYGLALTLRDAGPVELPRTALRFSVAAVQAGALRRWAGLADRPQVS
jgi:hypothetical protein